MQIFEFQSWSVYLPYLGWPQLRKACRLLAGQPLRPPSHTQVCVRALEPVFVLGVPSWVSLTDSAQASLPLGDCSCLAWPGLAGRQRWHGSLWRRPPGFGAFGMFLVRWGARPPAQGRPPVESGCDLRPWFLIPGCIWIAWEVFISTDSLEILT